MLRTVLAIAFAVGAVALAAPHLEQIAARPESASQRATPAQPAGYRSLALEANEYGQFHVETVVNGRRLEMLADTGATAVVLNAGDAARIGIRPREREFTAKMQTANGIARAAPVTIEEIRIGAIRVRDVRALVAEEGALDVNLLGMSFIGALKRFELKGGTLTLVQ